MNGLDDIREYLQWWRVLRQIWHDSKDFRDFLQTWKGRKSVAETPPLLSRLLIIGPGGVGKSTLGRLMAGRSPDFTGDETRYLESLAIEELQLREPNATVVIPPGQLDRRERFWPDYDEDIRNGQFDGIILVTSYGYHSLGELSLSSVIAAREDETVDRQLQRYLKRCRQDETAVAKRVASALSRSVQPCWLLTLVTKEDLWFDERKAVERHYRSGTYGRALSTLLQDHSVIHRRELAFACLVSRNFVTGRNELLAKTTAGYDWPEMAESWQRLWRLLADLRRGEPVE